MSAYEDSQTCGTVETPSRLRLFYPETTPCAVAALLPSHPICKPVGQQLTLGRSGVADVRLNDERMSRLYAGFFHDGKDPFIFKVANLSERKSIMVDGIMLRYKEEGEIKDGSEIILDFLKFKAKVCPGDLVTFSYQVTFVKNVVITPPPPPCTAASMLVKANSFDFNRQPPPEGKYPMPGTMRRNSETGQKHLLSSIFPSSCVTPSFSSAVTTTSSFPSLSDLQQEVLQSGGGFLPKPPHHVHSMLPSQGAVPPGKALVLKSALRVLQDKHNREGELREGNRDVQEMNGNNHHLVHRFSRQTNVLMSPCSPTRGFPDNVGNHDSSLEDSGVTSMLERHSQGYVGIEYELPENIPTNVEAVIEGETPAMSHNGAGVFSQCKKELNIEKGAYSKLHDPCGPMNLLRDTESSLQPQMNILPDTSPVLPPPAAPTGPFCQSRCEDLYRPNISNNCDMVGLQSEGAVGGQAYGSPITKQSCSMKDMACWFDLGLVSLHKTPSYPRQLSGERMEQLNSERNLPPSYSFYTDLPSTGSASTASGSSDGFDSNLTGNDTSREYIQNGNGVSRDYSQTGNYHRGSYCQTGSDTFASTSTNLELREGLRKLTLKDMGKQNGGLGQCRRQPVENAEWDTDDPNINCLM